MLGSFGFIITWVSFYDDLKGESNVYAQRFDNKGREIDGGFQVNLVGWVSNKIS